MAEAQTIVACLCAEWCGVCRDYRPGFLALAARFPQAQFRWLDIEDDSAQADDVEIESFPMLRIARGEAVLFQGAMPPQPEHLARLLQKLLPSAQGT